MKDMLAILVRSTVLVALLVFLVAVGIGRWQQPEPLDRSPVAAVPVSIHNEVCQIFDRTSRFLRPGEADVIALGLPKGQTMDRASVSPWRDARGSAQVVGRWMSHTQAPGDLASQGVGLARVTFPGGEPLDLVETSVLPTSPPCWLPGSTAQLIFTAGDGHLYRIDFETSTGKPLGDDLVSPRPEPIEWRVDGLSQKEVMVSDPFWSTDPRFHDTLLVSLCRRNASSTGSRRFRAAEIWWLRLDESRRAVVAAGALVESDESIETERTYRYPTVAVTDDGRCLLSFLTHGDDPRDSTLDVAPIRLEAGAAPLQLLAPPTCLARRCLLSPIAFAVDGRSIACVTAVQNGSATPGICVVDLTRESDTLLASHFGSENVGL